MQISEPVTMLTDYALAAASCFFSLSIFRNLNVKNRVTGLLWSLGFMAAGAGAFIGGTYHGFALEIEPQQLRWLWNITVFSLGAAGGFIISAIHTAVVRRVNAKWLVAGALLTGCGYLVQLTGFRSHLPFNHNDIYHVIQIAALYLLFMGARSLQDRSYSPR